MTAVLAGASSIGAGTAPMAAANTGRCYADALEERATELGEWRELHFFSSAFFGVLHAIAHEDRTILPPAEQAFHALELCPPSQARVVILGQDPYPTPGHANGLAFSVAPCLRPLPRSLANVFREIEADLGACPEDGDLSFWARQGVLLLNAVLTVPAGLAGGHRGLGWEELTGEVLALLDEEPRAFLLWGREAQRLARQHLARSHHLLIETAHPSPLSARRGFFGARPFSRVNAWLQERGMAPIDWIGCRSEQERTAAPHE